MTSIISSSVIDNVRTEMKEEVMELDDFDGMHQPEESTDSKSDIDPVSEVWCSKIITIREAVVDRVFNSN